VCKCDPDDPGDCCARDMASYVTTCPLLASLDVADTATFDSMDEADAGAGVLRGLEVGMAAQSAFAGAVKDAGGILGGLGVGVAAQSAFAIAVKDAAAKQVERHQYYAAVVQTAGGAAGAGAGAGAGGAGYEVGTQQCCPPRRRTLLNRLGTLVERSLNPC